LFKKLNELLIVSEFLIMLEEIFQMVWMNDDLETTESSSLEFLCSDTCEANSFPNFWNVSFLGGFISCDVVFKHNMDLCKFLVVTNSCEKNLGCLIELVVIASLSNFEKVSLIWI